jgi:glycerol kinase
LAGNFILSLDEGSSSARAVITDFEGRIVGEASRPIEPMFPNPGWAELSPADLWDAPKACIEQSMKTAKLTAKDIAAVGVTSHRETITMWDRKSGKPVYNTIMWMSKQTDEIVAEWSARGLDDEFRRRTGVRNDSYFSAAKIVWLLRNVPGVREKAERGELAIGTPDVWMLWNLSGGRSHRIEGSAASRTALLDINTTKWDEEFCEILGIPVSLLPEIVPSVGYFGEVAEGVLTGKLSHSVPIMAMLGDQQSGLFGQACLTPGSAKNTFGTAGVLTVNVGNSPKVMNGMSSSVAWQIGDQVTYEAEGVVFHSGQTIQWLRDKLKLFSSTHEVESLAESVPNSAGVYLVPAFAGLCDPYWDRNVKAAVMGLTLESTSAHVARAGIESMAFQTRDNVDQLRSGGIEIEELKVDGAATKNNLLCQIQADILGIPVIRPLNLERTVLGIAHLAGVGIGLWSAESISQRWILDRTFEPRMGADERETTYAGWQRAVAAARSVHKDL